MLAEIVGDGVSWQLVAVICTIAISIILALAGALTHQIAARFNRQSVKHEDLRKVVYDYMGASRERAARMETSLAETDKKYVHNIPELFNRMNGVEKTCASCKGKGGE